ncbi:hypothetical protein SLS58_009699 [Diplodia intermedia]|uniref:Uncharacterized protein n=1 Tax=Diplodia intermedia TaxID=856260 RepID=A0ABR3TAR1_9PEZI
MTRSRPKQMLGSKSDKQWQRYMKADFNALASLWVPDVDAKALRPLLDWNNWVFFFDDQFDEGHLQYDIEAAEAECNAVFALFDDKHAIVSAEENPLRHVFQHNWLCFQKKASREQQERYKQSMKMYLDSVTSHVRTASTSATLDLDEYVKHRRGSIGVFPAQDWVE